MYQSYYTKIQSFACESFLLSNIIRDNYKGSEGCSSSCSEILLFAIRLRCQSSYNDDARGGAAVLLCREFLFASCQSGFDQGMMQPGHTGEGLFGRRIIRWNKNHTSTRPIFNGDSQFQVPWSIIWHFLTYYTS